MSYFGKRRHYKTTKRHETSVHLYITQHASNDAIKEQKIGTHT